MLESFSPADWERYALYYDALLHLSPYRDMLRLVSKHILTSGPTRILDASCGTGNLPITLQQLESDGAWSLLGVDMAETMLARAREKCASLPHCSFKVVDLNAPLPFLDSCFTQVASLNTLYATENPSQTLHEFHRVLESGGTVFIVTPRCDYENGVILKEHCGSEKPLAYWGGIHDDPVREETLVREAIQDESIVMAMLEIARINRHIAHNSRYHFFTTAELIRLVESCGFQVESYERVYARQDDFIIARKGS
jgi:SAM-dependent methyltransferase